jgi:hypothetical protein
MAFNFQAYRNPYVSTIAELLSRGEDAKAKALVDVANAQARAAEARGQAYGGAIESVGKIVSGIPAQIQAGKDQAFQKAQRERLIVQQARDDAATTRLDQSRIAADRFRSNPNATTVIPGQAGSLPDRMLPSFSPDTFVPDGAATSTDMLGGMLRKANVFGQQPASQRLADTIPSASMSGVAAVAPRLAATMTGPDTTTTTNTSTRRDENGLELWDVEGYKQQEAAAGRGAEAQVTAKAMMESNDEMVKHYASAVALMQGDARRLSNQPDALLETGIDQLIERYRKNAVLPQEQLDAAAQQVDAIKQLPQEQQSLARRKFLRSVSGDKPNIVSGKPGDIFFDPDTREVIGSVAQKEVPVTLVGAPYGKLDKNGKPQLFQRLSDRTEYPVGPPIPPAATGSRSEAVSPTAKLSATMGLRTQVGKETNAAKTVETQLANMEDSLKAVKGDADAAGSQGVLTTFQKILDPLSVVRESEYARSASGLSLLASLQGIYDKYTEGGGGVPVAELEKFVALARQFAKNQRDSTAQTVESVTSIVNEYGINPVSVFGKRAGASGGTEQTAAASNPSKARF